MSKSFSNNCLATVTTPSFLIGTIVMLDSFLHHNRWFRGDIVIIHNQLPINDQKLLCSRFPTVIFLQVSQPLESAIAALTNFRPALASRQARFYSLEAINLDQYQRVFFCDSDLLFTDSVEPLFLKNHEFICCGDGIYYRGGGLLRDSFEQRRNVERSDPNMLYDTFNSGMMLFDRALLGKEAYEHVLAQLSLECWEKVKNNHTDDQIVLNRVYAGKQHIVSAEYNYLMAHRNIIFNRCHLTMDEAKVLHFNGRAKPWLPEHVLHKTLQDPAYIKAVKYWQVAYIECLQRLHLTMTYASN